MEPIKKFENIETDKRVFIGVYSTIFIRKLLLSFEEGLEKGLLHKESSIKSNYNIYYVFDVFEKYKDNKTLRKEIIDVVESKIVQNKKEWIEASKSVMNPYYELIVGEWCLNEKYQELIFAIGGNDVIIARDLEKQSKSYLVSEKLKSKNINPKVHLKKQRELLKGKITLDEYNEAILSN